MALTLIIVIVLLLLAVGMTGWYIATIRKSFSAYHSAMTINDRTIDECPDWYIRDASTGMCHASDHVWGRSISPSCATINPNDKNICSIIKACGVTWEGKCV